MNFSIVQDDICPVCINLISYIYNFEITKILKSILCRKF